MTDREDVRREKARLRAAFRAARLALSDADYAARSALIRDRLLALPEVEAARTVHCYWPLTAKREVDTRPLIAALHARGVRVVLPVVVPPSESSGPTLRHRPFEGEDRLRPSRWGLLEPIGPDAAPHALDVVVVPAFGAGRNGHRIGHGAGYYDAFLAETPAFTVCPVYAACLVPHVPAEPHDRPVDVVATEDEEVRLRG
ncbi:MAG: 5-formyltetrahydrofolate cyclo-ligase [Rubricoccaceae bacterium]|nr:5-formyltetrahydrofolate cyclo-ligase [Rubricoccaceae bacterium]